MNKTLLTFLLFLTFISVKAQEKTEVLLLGTYHFGGTTTDNVKVTNDDILSPKKQKELQVVLEKLAQFKPQKIYIECEPPRQKYWDSIYVAYKQGKDIKIKSELFQVGVKLAAKLNLKNGVTCVDWDWQRGQTFAEKEYLKLLNSMYYYEVPDEEPWSEYSKQNSNELKNYNTRISSLELIDVFKHMNSESYLDKMFYGTFSSMLDIDKYDINVFWSQNNMIRNIHIYQNIIRDIIISKPKRVLIIFGAAHIKALENYFEVHPAIKIVNAKNILK